MLKMRKLSHFFFSLSRRSQLAKKPYQLFSDLKSSKEELKIALNEEIAAEEEQEGEKDEFMEKFLEQTEWKYLPSLDTAKILLTKNVDGTDVQVVYHARSPQFQDEPED